MKENDNIEDWYKNELSNYSVDPDKDGWESISDKLDANTPLTDATIGSWYKKEVTKLEERPDYTVWEKLSTKLDTTTVWDKLIVSLTKYEQLIWWRNTLLKGGSILLLFLGSYLAFNRFYEKDYPLLPEKISYKNGTTIGNEVSAKKQKAFVSEIDSYKYDTNKSSLSNKNVIYANDYPKSDPAPTKTKYPLKNKTHSPKNESNSPNNDGTLLASNNKVSKINSLTTNGLGRLNTNKSIGVNFKKHQLSDKDVFHLYKSGEFLVKKNNNKIVFNSKRFSAHFLFGVYARRIYVGINNGIKKQGIINTIDKNAVLADYKQKNFLDFGGNFGATVGLILSDKINVETNINLYSTSGYKREFNDEGVTLREDLNLNYSTVSFLVKKMANKSTFDNKKYSSNIIAGNLWSLFNFL